MGEAHVVSELVAKAEVAKGAALLADGDGVPGGDGVEVGHAAAVEVDRQEGSGVGRVPQPFRIFLHGPEGRDEGAGVLDVVDGGGLDAEFGDSEGDSTVDVALVRLGQHLVDEAGDVGSDSLEVGSVVEHDGVGGLGDVVGSRQSHQLGRLGACDRLLRSLEGRVGLEAGDVELLPSVAAAALLDAVGLARRSLEATEKIASGAVVGDDGLITLATLVHEAVGLDCGDKVHGDTVQNDGVAVGQQLGEDEGVPAGEKVAVRAADLPAGLAEADLEEALGGGQAAWGRQ